MCMTSNMDGYKRKGSVVEDDDGMLFSDPFSIHRDAPEKIESFFRTYTGLEITENYVSNIESSLENLDRKIESYMPPNYTVFSSLISFSVMCVGNPDGGARYSVQVSRIAERPCGEGMGIFYLYLWQLILSCKACSRHLIIHDPTIELLESLEQTKSIMSFFYTINQRVVNGQQKFDILLRTADMAKLAFDDFRLDGMTFTRETHLVLKSEGFPEASKINAKNVEIFGE